MLKFILPLGAAILASAAAAQTGGIPLKHSVTMSGTCAYFSMAGRDMTRNCNPALLNPVYTNGRMSFMFAMKDGSIVSFYGRDTRAVRGRAVMHVEKITVQDGLSRAPKPTGANARGTCTYGDGGRGPVTVTCNATAMGRNFNARFIGDGRAPLVTRGR